MFTVLPVNMFTVLPVNMFTVLPVNKSKEVPSVSYLNLICIVFPVPNYTDLIHLLHNFARVGLGNRFLKSDSKHFVDFKLTRKAPSVTLKNIKILNL